MSVTTASRLLSPEEIAVQAGQQVPYVRLPERDGVFAARELRLRQLAAGHPMRDYLLFIAELARAQQALLKDYPAVALPTPEATADAAQAGVPPLPAEAWPRDPAWRTGLQRLLDDLLPRLQGSPAQATVRALRDLPADALERQANKLLTGVTLGLDLATAPLVAAALQVYWTALVLQTEASRGADRLPPFGRTDDATLCPCCGSRPTASVTRIGGDAAGYRYLHCALCSAQWHMVRIKCTHCSSTKGIGYQSLEPLPGHALPATGAAKDAVQAETCEDCGHYLKVVHMERDNQVEPVADDLASLTLDLLVSEAGRQRHGVNLLLLFGDGDGDGDASDGADAGGRAPEDPPPDPGSP